MRLPKLLLLLVAGSFAACSTPGVYQRPGPTVVFLTDFGTEDDSVALCKGVMWSVDPNLRIVDLTHDVPPYDIRTAGRLIAGTAPYYPSGTVFLAVVDPGVGSERKALAVLSKKGRYYVGPDNGVFSRVLDAEGIQEAREITNPDFMRSEYPSSTFHGRDIFSPAAAYLADHALFETIGPILTGLVRGPESPQAKLEAGELVGNVDFIERPYGNAVTNIPADLAAESGAVPGCELELRLGEGTQVRVFRVPFRKTFSDVPQGQAVALISSRGFLILAINQGDLSQQWGLKGNEGVRLRPLKEKTETPTRSDLP